MPDSEKAISREMVNAVKISGSLLTMILIVAHSEINISCCHSDNLISKLNRIHCRSGVIVE